MTLEDLERAGFDIDVRNHALAVLEGDFSDPLAELCKTLIAVEIEAVDLIAEGFGGAHGGGPDPRGGVRGQRQGAALRGSAERGLSALPGSAPVCSPCAITGSPLTITCDTPTA